MDNLILSGFQSAGAIIVYVFSSILSLLRSNGLSRVLIYVFILGVVVAVLRFLLGGSGD